MKGSVGVKLILLPKAYHSKKMVFFGEEEFMTNIKFQKDDHTFDADAYRVKGYSGIAWYVLGWELVERGNPDWDDSYEERTDRVVCVMVGDDRRFVFDQDEIEPLNRDKYCGSCGQIGCRHS